MRTNFDEQAILPAIDKNENVCPIGLIQSVGCLIALNDSTFLIEQVSCNIGLWFDVQPEQLIGQPFSLLVGQEQADAIRHISGLKKWRQTAIITLDLTLHDQLVKLDAQISCCDDLWLIEFEHIPNETGDAFQNLFVPIRNALWQMEAEADFSLYTQLIVSQVRLLTGYDRVMMYQFHGNWDSEVIAECKNDEVKSFLGCRFPALDISVKARDLFSKNSVLQIADIEAKKIAISPNLNGRTGMPLNLTYSAMRAMPSVYLHHLKNLGVKGALTISLMQQNRLWGLIVCHHLQPKYLPLRLRGINEFIGKAVSLRLSNMENEKKAELHDRTKIFLEKLSSEIKLSHSLKSDSSKFNQELIALISADGVTLNLNGQLVQSGQNVPEGIQQQIDHWLNTPAPRKIFQSQLQSCSPAATVGQTVCSVLIMPLNLQLDSYIAWFRSKTFLSLNYVDYINKAAWPPAKHVLFSPNENFDQWINSICHHSPCWSDEEISTAQSLALSLSDSFNLLALKQSEENFRFVTDNSNDLIVRFNADMVYNFVSPACEHILGYRSEQMVGKPVLDFVFKDDRAQFRETIEYLNEQRETDTLLFRPLHAHSKELWLEYSFKRSTNPTSGEAEIIANGRDVTQQYAYQLSIEELRRRNAMTLNPSSDCVINFDHDGKILYSNDMVHQLLGWCSSSLTGRDGSELLHEKSTSRLGELSSTNLLLQAIRQQQGSHSATCYCRHRDGSAVHIKYICTPLNDGSDQTGFVVIFNAVDEIKITASPLFSKTLLDDENADMVLVTDSRLKIVSVNRAFVNITGYCADEVIGHKPRMLKSGVHTQNFYQNMLATLLEKRYWSGEIWNRRKNGEIYPQWGSLTGIFNAAGKLQNVIAVFSDMYKIKYAEERLYFLANHDALTGLANRNRFVDYVNKAIDTTKRTANHKIAVAFIDLDCFKFINDTLGHAVGDLYLQAIGSRIAAFCRSTDLLSRWGGDEFILLLDNVVDHAAVAEVISRLLEDIRQPFSIEGHELCPTISVGVSIFPDDADNTTDLIKAADTAMYRVKENGRNDFAFVSENQASESQQKFALVSEINRGLRQDEFTIYYQPQIKPLSCQIVGLEALIRWNHPLRGQLNPAEFIPQAEELGLISDLGKWVLRTVCLQIAQWSLNKIQTPRIAINISPFQLNQTLVTFVTDILRETAVDSSLLELELTERSLNYNSNVSVILHQLHKLGITISIDDFGTGRSSLGHLKNFPVSKFKIDKTLVSGLPHNAQDVGIVKTILSMGENLQAEIVVEGVETEEQSAFLASIGAQVIQGFYYGQPLSVDEITHILQNGAQDFICVLPK